ncbi:beta-mannosyltransferase 5 [[Candida] jaroonii]|uniref:Beta-mannosyltransferase 5 n=1 Tax=[Candida] jaroonii TaxID=467808 RepID=A0ACA9Y7Q3_9ASCO|nr:beta-mannosyltransferase 5 [[Candida] jaroonii]
MKVSYQGHITPQSPPSSHHPPGKQPGHPPGPPIPDGDNHWSPGHAQDSDNEWSRPKISSLNKEKVVLFPKSFPVQDPELSDFYFNNFNTDSKASTDNIKVIKYDNPRKYSDALDFTDIDDDTFHGHSMKTFNSYKDIDDGKCNELEKDIDIEVQDMRPMDDDLDYILKKFMESESDYYKEIEPYFGNNLHQQLIEGTIDQHWYKLAGTSVWLEQYGVHYMISRIIYSPRGVRNQPSFSLTYVQIYDQDWNEMKDIQMVIPTNDPESIHDQIDINGVFFKKVSYPSFLPIPALHDASKTKGKFYGAEDPRILLIKDEYGFEEPLIVFNSFHRKIIENNEVNENEMSLKFGFYRSMFMCWPWKFQRGKRIIDELPNEQNDKNIYNKVIELRREGTEREKVQKNWTPFIDFEERQTSQHDKYIYFVYRWSNLEVLKCQLTDTIGGASKCNFVYKMIEDLPGSESVGPLRGGTELISINSLLKDSELDSKITLPRNTQIWIGFARAHLKNCGCGKDIYRPNLVVISKDMITGRYKVDIVSSFASLDVPVIGWDLNKPKETCVEGQPSVFIPNGISSWSLKPQDSGFFDYLTLSFSLSDATNDLIQLKNVLSSVLKIFKASKTGYDNRNVDCALQASQDFCKKVGDDFRNQVHS